MTSLWSTVNKTGIHLNSTDIFIHNQTQNQSIADNDIMKTKITNIILIFLISSMSLMTIFGNILVIIAFIRESSIRTYSNYFILNLSIADLLIGLIW